MPSLLCGVPRSALAGIPCHRLGGALNASQQSNQRKRGGKSHLHMKIMLGCDLGRSMHFQWRSISKCGISVLTSQQNAAMGVMLHTHFALLNTHRRLPVSFQLIKFAPQSTKGVQV